MSLRGAPAFRRSSLQTTQRLFRRKEKVLTSQRHDEIYSFQLCGYTFLTPTLTFSPSNSSSTTDESSGGVVKDNLDVSVSEVMYS